MYALFVGVSAEPDSEFRTFRLENDGFPLGRFALQAGVVAACCSFGVIPGVVALFFLGGTTALPHLATGMPKAISVSPEKVIVHFSIRRSCEFATSELQLQVLPEELVLVSPERTVAFTRDNFTAKDLRICGEALAEVIPNVHKAEVRDAVPGTAKAF